MTTESEVRAMRDKVYGEQTSNFYWDYAKAHWMKLGEIAWLKEQLEKRKVAGVTIKS